MTEGEVAVGKVYRLASAPTGQTYKKISPTVTVACDEQGRQTGRAENVHPFDEVLV